MGRGSGGGLVVSVIDLYSGDLSSNPAKANTFLFKTLFEKDENKLIENHIPGVNDNKCLIWS